MRPEFPLKVKFDDGDEWTLETVEEVETSLEWFDTDNVDKSALVFDRQDRPVRLKVEGFKMMLCEVAEAVT